MTTDASLADKRHQRRQRVLKAGTIAFGGSHIDCAVRNISTTGAALEVESQAGIPTSFELLITADRFIRRCHVVWRRGRRLGIAFETALAQ